MSLPVLQRERACLREGSSAGTDASGIAHGCGPPTLRTEKTTADAHRATALLTGDDQSAQNEPVVALLRGLRRLPLTAGTGCEDESAQSAMKRHSRLVSLRAGELYRLIRIQSGVLMVRYLDIYGEPRYIAIGVASDQDPDLDDVPTPTLLRGARGAYGQAIRQALSDRGIDDMPPNGAFVIGGIGNQGQPLGALVQQLRVTKQAASELIDTLVVRGYLSRTTDPDDRRRVNVTRTDRGHEAADAVLAGVLAVDRELTELLGVSGLEQLRAGLVALCNIRDRVESELLPGTDRTAG